MEKVKNHFEEEAKVFDELILKIIPFYPEMVSSLVHSIPFYSKDRIKVLDLGCGTGNIAQSMKERFPRASITCVDLAENMIEIARLKLVNLTDITFLNADFRDLDFNEEFDVVVSSLAIHHLQPEEQKQFYSEIYEFLKDGGVFYNADNFLGPTPHLQNVYIEKWIEFMLQNLTREEIETVWLPKHQEEDIPVPLEDHLIWLEEAGFSELDVVWKYYGFGVYGGTKR